MEGGSRRTRTAREMSIDEAPSPVIWEELYDRKTLYQQSTFCYGSPERNTSFAGLASCIDASLSSPQDRAGTHGNPK